MAAVELEIWHDPDAEDPTVVSTVDELDAAVDQIVVATAGHEVPSAAQVVVKGDPYAHVALEVGLGRDRGFLSAVGDDGGLSVGDPSKPGTVTYDYMRHAQEVPARAELPIAQVRQALREYLTSGGKIPTNVTFEPDDVHTG